MSEDIEVRKEDTLGAGDASGRTLCVRHGGFLKWGCKSNECSALGGILYHIRLIEKHSNDGLGGESVEGRERVEERSQKM